MPFLTSYRHNSDIQVYSNVNSRKATFKYLIKIILIILLHEY